MSQRFLVHLVIGALLLLGMGLAMPAAWAQADPPGRVARLNLVEGAITFSPAGDNEWVDAEPNRPLVRGDRLWTDKGSRAEVQAGSASIRMSGQTQLEVLALDDQSTQLSVTQGTVYVRVRSLPEGENFEIDTPNLAYRAAYPGDYRVDVDAGGGATRVTIHSGTGAVYGEAGESLPLGGGQQITFRARSLAQVDRRESPPQDNFDRWAAERNRREDQSISARYVPREVVGYQQLDAHGQWMQDAGYGAVWFPKGMPENWAPYRDGHWEWIAPWGWSWIDEAPWGFAPSHYGRWALIDSRWAWVPGRLGLRPAYAPALVAFIGGGSTAAWSIPIAAGRPGIAWFPLAPGEPWQPGFAASAAYVSRINGGMPAMTHTRYVHQNRPESLTAISSEDFQKGRPVRAGWLRVAANALTQAQIVPPPPMPQRRAPASRERPALARAAPPPASAMRQAAASAPADAQQAKTGDAKPAAQAKLAQEAKPELAAQPTRAAQQERAAQQAKPAQRPQRIEQAKATPVPKREQHAKRATPSRREHVARRGDAPKGEAARRGHHGKHMAVARRDDKPRQDTHAQQVEKARRAAEREAETLRQQREQARRDGREYEQYQRETWDRYQQAVSEQWRRNQQAARQQRDKARLN